MQRFREIKTSLESSQLLHNAWNTSIVNNCSLAAWRIPGGECNWMAGSFEPVLLNEITPPVFIRSMFLNTVPGQALIPDLAYIDGKVFSAENGMLPYTDVLTDKQHEPYKPGGCKSLDSPDSKDKYISGCKSALEFIQRNSIQKVVLARKKPVSLSESFSPPAFFLELCRKYPDAFVSLVHDATEQPQQTWIGASPELLLDVDKKAIQTMSLAGTRLGDDTGFSDKEKAEQDWVSRYINEQLKHSGYKYKQEANEVKKAGHLSHISTGFRIRKNGDWRNLLDILHPTPAVCGYPVEHARTFITNNEPFRRNYYAGFLGPVLGDDLASVYVNLRCMEVTGSTANLYAGAGIVKGSDPDSEWQETEIKIDTLQNLL